jgi:hypothetical protein
VIALENARLLGELQARADELTRSVGELQALEEVLRAVNSSLDLDTVLATIISRAAQLSQADVVIHQYPDRHCAAYWTPGSDRCCQTWRPLYAHPA